MNAETEDGIPIIDEPFWSFSRIYRGIKQWFYLVIVNELDMKYGLWYFVKYYRRPYASHKDGGY